MWQKGANFRRPPTFSMGPIHMFVNGRVTLTWSTYLTICISCAGATTAGSQATTARKRSTDSVHAPQETAGALREKRNKLDALETFAALVRNTKYGGWICYASSAHVAEGCTWSEYQVQSNWHGAWANFDLYKFVFPGDGTAQLMIMGDFGWQPAARGTPQGPASSNFHWECFKTDKKGRVLGSYPCFFRPEADFSKITLSFETADPKASPNARYVYWSLRKR